MGAGKAWIEDFWQDLRFAARILEKKAAFTAVAAATLALGIGAATAVFSIVDAVLLRPLPYRDPDRLVAIWDRGLRDKGLEKIFDAYADFEDWSRNARSFESVAAATWAFSPTRILTGRGPAKQLLAIPVSASFFDTLGVHAALGRTFTAEDERHGCAVVLSHAFWAATLGSDRSIVGPEPHSRSTRLRRSRRDAAHLQLLPACRAIVDLARSRLRAES